MATLLTPHYSPPDRAHRPAPHGDRSVRWTIVTAILALGAFFLQPRLAGGNSFTPLALMATLPVILWAAIPLSRYKTPREHVVALIAALLALGSLALTWIGNLRFLFS